VKKINYVFEKLFYYKIFGGGFSGLGLRLLCVSSMRNNNKGQCNLPGFFFFSFHKSTQPFTGTEAVKNFGSKYFQGEGRGLKEGRKEKAPPPPPSPYLYAPSSPRLEQPGSRYG